MSNLHILREHALGLPKARKIAFAWAEHVESEFGMECTYEEGNTEDVVAFVRSGVHGMLHVMLAERLIDMAYVACDGHTV